MRGMANPHGLVIGQSLFYVPTAAYRQPCEIPIIKIGNKWATLKNHERVNLVTLLVDGGEYSSPATCYLDAAAWEASKALSARWEDFAQAVTFNRMPSGVTVSDIDAAAKILKLT
jgi:hypothetical protein